MAADPSVLADMIYTEMRNEYWPETVLPPEAEAETKRYYRVIAKALIQYFGTNAAQE
jgi:hypothetical protein